MTERISEYLTTSELARLAGRSQSLIRRLVANGTIPAEKIANRWVIHRDDAARFLAHIRREGDD